ncbi:DUF1934 domain-containing protein [Desulfocucumis palustris]|uniref:DUF1934 domain-containing protein n=1 Tax=Desulfocucumis palustris TaxID=1898651 RepID=UPI000CE9D8D8|nr:DUF1934 domain-containing protein [Desulfocucumis palustris]
MSKEVLVTVKGTQTNEFGEKDTIELVTRGNYYYKNNSYYIVYNESRLSGLEGTTTSLKAEPDRVTLNRMGAAEMKQIFQEGVHNQGMYVTSCGSLEMRVLPRKVKVLLDHSGGSIDLGYDIEMGSKKLGYNELSITVKEL